MISIVIPTMMGVNKDNLHYSVKQAIESEIVDRITIIDNSTDRFSKEIPLRSSKLIVRSMTKNIFVNPAWNIGVSLSTSDNVLIMNDDILCHKEVYRQVNEVMGYENLGLCSVKTHNCNKIDDYIRNIDDFNAEIVTDDTFDPSQNNNKTGWFFCVKKKLWKDIPEKLLFFYGDDLIYDRVRYMKYLTKNISSCIIGHVGSQTVNKNVRIQNILIEEHKAYQKEKDDYLR
jgi:hypothetical protein